jgi:hypothetical protein
MNNYNFASEFIRAAAVQLPIFIASLIGVIITVTRWKDAPDAALWSLLGFGLSAVLSILIPAGQTGMRYYLTQNSGAHAGTAEAFMALAVFWSLLRAASYGLLAAAVFAGRSRNL